jgi:hypothetical protein
MDRKKFIRNSLIAAAAGITVPGMLKAKRVNNKISDYDKMIDQVGFNHLPRRQGGPTK